MAETRYIFVSSEENPVNPAAGDTVEVNGVTYTCDEENIWTYTASADDNEAVTAAWQAENPVTPNSGDTVEVDGVTYTYDEENGWTYETSTKEAAPSEIVSRITTEFYTPLEGDERTFTDTGIAYTYDSENGWTYETTTTETVTATGETLAAILANYEPQDGDSKELNGITYTFDSKNGWTYETTTTETVTAVGETLSAILAEYEPQDGDSIVFDGVTYTFDGTNWTYETTETAAAAGETLATIEAEYEPQDGNERELNSITYTYDSENGWTYETTTTETATAAGETLAAILANYEPQDSDSKELNGITYTFDSENGWTYETTTTETSTAAGETLAAILANYEPQDGDSKELNGITYTFDSENGWTYETTTTETASAAGETLAAIKAEYEPQDGDSIVFDGVTYTFDSENGWTYETTTTETATAAGETLAAILANYEPQQDASIDFDGVTYTYDGSDWTYDNGTEISVASAEIVAAIMANWFSPSDGDTQEVDGVEYTYSSETGLWTAEISSEVTETASAEVAAAIMANWFSPSDGDTQEVDGVTYTYSSETGLWTGTVFREVTETADDDTVAEILAQFYTSSDGDTQEVDGVTYTYSSETGLWTAEIISEVTETADEDTVTEIIAQFYTPEDGAQQTVGELEYTYSSATGLWTAEIISEVTETADEETVAEIIARFYTPAEGDTQEFDDTTYTFDGENWIYEAAVTNTADAKTYAQLMAYSTPSEGDTQELDGVTYTYTGGEWIYYVTTTYTEIADEETVAEIIAQFYSPEDGAQQTVGEAEYTYSSETGLWTAEIISEVTETADEDTVAEILAQFYTPKNGAQQTLDDVTYTCDEENGWTYEVTGTFSAENPDEVDAAYQSENIAEPTESDTVSVDGVTYTFDGENWIYSGTAEFVSEANVNLSGAEESSGGVFVVTGSNGASAIFMEGDYSAADDEQIVGSVYVSDEEGYIYEAASDTFLAQNLTVTSGWNAVATSLDDTIRVEGDNATIDAGAGNDSIQNGSGYDTTLAANVIINAGEGNDSIYNYGEYSTIYGGNGDDFVFNNSGYSSIIGEEGNDSINNNGDSVTIDAGAGDDFIGNLKNNVLINSDDSNDTIYNWGSDVTIDAGAGNDIIVNYNDAVTITTGDGRDTVLIINESVTSVTFTDLNTDEDILSFESAIAEGSMTYTVDDEGALVLSSDDISITWQNASELTEEILNYTVQNGDGTNTVRELLGYSPTVEVENVSVNLNSAASATGVFQIPTYNTVSNPTATFASEEDESAEVIGYVSTANVYLAEDTYAQEITVTDNWNVTATANSDSINVTGSGATVAGEGGADTISVASGVNSVVLADLDTSEDVLIFADSIAEKSLGWTLDGGALTLADEDRVIILNGVNSLDEEILSYTVQNGGSSNALQDLLYTGVESVVIDLNSAEGSGFFYVPSGNLDSVPTAEFAESTGDEDTVVGSVEENVYTSAEDSARQIIAVPENWNVTATANSDSINVTGSGATITSGEGTDTIAVSSGVNSVTFTDFDTADVLSFADSIESGSLTETASGNSVNLASDNFSMTFAGVRSLSDEVLNYEFDNGGTTSTIQELLVPEIESVNVYLDEVPAGETGDFFIETGNRDANPTAVFSNFDEEISGTIIGSVTEENSYDASGNGYNQNITVPENWYATATPNDDFISVTGDNTTIESGRGNDTISVSSGVTSITLEDLDTAADTLIFADNIAAGSLDTVTGDGSVNLASDNFSMTFNGVNELTEDLLGYSFDNGGETTTIGDLLASSPEIDDELINPAAPMRMSLAHWSYGYNLPITSETAT